jgi:hypothetical protein
MRDVTVMKLAPIALVLAFLAARAEADVFALIVTNNHSTQLGRPDLRYADDDGAKYFEVFSMLAPAGNVHLLSELDRDTRGLFPRLADLAKPPTTKGVVAAAADIARRSKAALDAGRSVEVYFVFAGHGDVDRGTGFLELADGSFTAGDVDKHILAGIPATRTHVILDSCNSFFVINARKPGGRRFATPNDLTEAFAKKLPHVGVFLSTSAEQEVYEWSELQSGIFSHAVRSGLLGAADVDNDGTVSYSELHAFVTIASAKVKNPQYRPQVFARGPAGKNEVSLVSLDKVDAVSVTVGPKQTRLTVRDRDQLPWIDAHVEKGATIRMRIPHHAVDGGAIEELGADLSVTSRWTLPAERAPTTLASLTGAEQLSEARGPQNLLRMLFEEPFGPGAYGRLDEYLVPQQGFGVSQDDVERMDLLLGAVADQQRSLRLTTGLGLYTLAAAYGGGYLYFREGLRGNRDSDAVLAGLVGVAVLAGTIELLTLSKGEKIQRDFRRRMLARRGDDGLIVADTERQLADLAASHARKRKIGEYVGWGLLALSAAVLVLGETADRPVPDPTFVPRRDVRETTRFTGAIGITTGALIVTLARLMRTPEERIYGLWRDDPSIRRIPRLGIAPANGGGMLTLDGNF